jgi:chitinase
MIIAFMMVFTCLIDVSFAAKPQKDTVSPSTPTNLRTVTLKDISISLAWDPSKDNVGVSSYYVYMNSTYIGASSTTAYTSSGLTPATTYKFYIKARDAAGNLSSSSSILTITTLRSSTVIPVPTPTPTPTPTATPISTPTTTPTTIPTSSPTPLPSPANTSKIVGYYAAWAAYSGFAPDKIDASKLTHINYAFANIGSDLKIALGYPDIDPSNFAKLNALKNLYPNIKTLIAVGGWSWSGKFSDVALTEVSRAAFADSCVDFIIKYGFDGIDIDWEYPVGGGMASNVKRPEDKQNFTLLLKTLRNKLDAKEALNGKHYLLSIAGGAGSSYVNNTELAILYQYLDYGNIMTYDLHGTWDTYTDFNAPLYNNGDTSPQYKISIDTAVKGWLNAGFPKGKLVMGIPFYGNKYDAVNNANNGLYQRYTGGASLSYANIASKYLNTPGFVRYYHSQSMVPWLFNGTAFISYDDEQSIGAKAQYIKANGLAGGMVWELSQDPNRVLLNSLYNCLK